MRWIALASPEKSGKSTSPASLNWTISKASTKVCIVAKQSDSRGSPKTSASKRTFTLETFWTGHDFLTVTGRDKRGRGLSRHELRLARFQVACFDASHLGELRTEQLVQ